MMTLYNGGAIVVLFFIAGIALYIMLARLRARRQDEALKAARLVSTITLRTSYQHFVYPCGFVGPAVARDNRGAHNTMNVLIDAYMNHFDECDDCQRKVAM